MRPYRPLLSRIKATLCGKPRSRWFSPLPVHENMKSHSLGTYLFFSWSEKRQNNPQWTGYTTTMETWKIEAEVKKCWCQFPPPPLILKRGEYKEMNADKKGTLGLQRKESHFSKASSWLEPPQKSNSCNPYYLVLTKVCQFEFANLADEQILGLDVSMQNSPSMAIGKSSQQLEHEKFDVARVQASGVALQVLRQVCVLEWQIKLFPLIHPHTLDSCCGIFASKPNGN